MSAAPRTVRACASAAILAAAIACGGAPPAPLVPELNSPADGAIADNACPSDATDTAVWDFDWSDVPGAASYELWVKHRSSQQPEIDEKGLQTTSHRAGRYATAEGPFLEGWEWKVRATVNGVEQPWSATRTFNVEPPDTDCQ